MSMYIEEHISDWWQRRRSSRGSTAASERGLYGSSTSGNALRPGLLELMGTALLTYGLIAFIALHEPLPVVAGIGGVIVTAWVAMTGRHSGSHINPCITSSLMMRSRRRAVLPMKFGLTYLGLQTAGGLLAAIGALLTPRLHAAAAHFGAPLWAVPGVNYWAVFAGEAFGGFLIVLGVLFTAVNRKVDQNEEASNLQAAITIGIMVALAIALTGSFTGGGVNPARSLGPMIVDAFVHHYWSWLAFLAYTLGPVVGGAIASFLYDFLQGADNPAS